MNQSEVRDVMTTSVITVNPDDSIHEAAVRLSANHISGMPVLARSQVVGVISESDIIQALTPPEERKRGMSLLDFVMATRSPSREPQHEPTVVDDVMSRVVTAVAPTATIWEAASEMHRRGVKRLPVTDQDGKLLGIISRGDLVRAIANDGDASAQ